MDGAASEGDGVKLVWERVLAKGAQREAERAAEQEAARPLFAELMTLPEDQRSVAVGEDSRFWTLAVADRFLQATERASAASTRMHSELALQIVEHLDGHQYGPSTLTGRRAIAWSFGADARRREGDLTAAEKGFQKAAHLLAGELLDAGERAGYCRRLAALRCDQERQDEALGLLLRAVELYQEWGEPILAADSVCDQADIWLAGGDPETALHLFQKAQESGETPAALPYVTIRVQHGLARCFAQLGDRAKATRILREAQPLYRLVLLPVERLRCLWTEANIEEEIGHTNRAASLLRPLIRRMVEEGAYYEAALVVLDLAQLAAERGKVGEVRRMAEQMGPLVTSERLPDRAGSILRFALRFASRLRPGIVEVLAQASDYLKRARENLQLPNPWEEVGDWPEQRWDDLPLDVKQRVCAEADLPHEVVLRPSSEQSPRVRELIAWTYQAVAGVRIRFDQ